jgi:L-threonylcarbamoyladenylate synthase
VAPLPVSLPQPSMIPTYVEVPDGFDRSIFDAMLPGEVSFVFWQRYAFPDQLTCGLHTVAVSVTTHPVMRSMVVGLGGPIAATSANVSGQGNVFIPLARAIEEVGDRVDLIVDAGATAAELAPDHANRVNTIVDLTFDKPRLVRPGWVSLEEVRTYLPDVDDDLDAYKALLAERTGAGA